MKIATSPTRDKYPLSTKKIVKKTLTRAFAWGFIFVPLIVVLGVLDIAETSLKPSDRSILTAATIGASALYLLIIALTYLYQRWYFAVYFYDLQDNYVVIRKNPITPREINIPYERLQDVYVDQDLLDRFLRIYDVHISSATASSGMEAHIDGVGREAAQGLRSDILTTVSKKIHKSGSPQPTPPAPGA